jgi:hypothetical protein
LARRAPAAFHAPDRAVDVEHLEHHLQAAAPQVDQGLQPSRGQRATRFGEHLQHALHLLLCREGE